MKLITGERIHSHVYNMVAMYTDHNGKLLDNPSQPYLLDDGRKLWIVCGRLHRTDGPAIEEADGTVRWMWRGHYHRTDGPAIMFPDGTNIWYVNDLPRGSVKEFQAASGLSDKEMAALILKYGDIC